MGRAIWASPALWLVGLIRLCTAAFALAPYVAVDGVLTGMLDQTLRAGPGGIRRHAPRLQGASHFLTIP